MVSSIKSQAPTTVKSLPRRCSLCGRSAADVVEHWGYTGGRGYGPTVPLCRDSGDCWERFDLQYGLARSDAYNLENMREAALA